MNRFVTLNDEDYENPDLLRNRFKGQPCFVVGASHSLNEINLKKLDGFLTIGINWTLGLFEPTFLQIIDGSVVEQERKKILAASKTQRLFRVRLKPFWPQPTIWFSYRSGRAVHKAYRLVRLPSQQMHFPGNSSWLAVNWAYIFGCNPIIMIGIDLDTKPRTADNSNSPVKTHYWGNGLMRNAYSARAGFKTEKMNTFFQGAIQTTLEPARVELLNASPYHNPGFSAVPRVGFDEVIERIEPFRHGKVVQEITDGGQG